MPGYLPRSQIICYALCGNKQIAWIAISKSTMGNLASFQSSVRQGPGEGPAIGPDWIAQTYILLPDYKVYGHLNHNAILAREVEATLFFNV